jgi:hypothetical protein
VRVIGQECGERRSVGAMKVRIVLSALFVMRQVPSGDLKKN